MVPLYLTDPAVGPQAEVIIPGAINREMGTVLTSSKSMPIPVIWLIWLPVPIETRQINRGSQEVKAPYTRGLEGGIHSLEALLIISPIHPSPRPILVSEAYPGVDRTCMVLDKSLGGRKKGVGGHLSLDHQAPR